MALTDVELAQLRDFGAKGPGVVIPNGVEPSPGQLDAQAFRRELRIPREALLAVFVGRLDVHRKGLDVLVRGIADASAWHLALVGPRFNGVERLERTISDLGLGDRVHLVGERHGTQLRQSVGGADLFALVSRWEGMPMALLEALSLGRPAVVSPAVERLIGVGAAGAGWVADEENLGLGAAPPARRRTGRSRETRPSGPPAFEAVRLGRCRAAVRGRVRASPRDSDTR